MRLHQCGSFVLSHMHIHNTHPFLFWFGFRSWLWIITSCAIFTHNLLGCFAGTDNLTIPRGFMVSWTPGKVPYENILTHWGRVTHICVGNLTIIGSDNGLSPGRRQAITWTNVGILLIGPLGTNFSGMLIEIRTFSFKKIHLKMSSGKWRPFCLGLNVLSQTMVNHDKTQQSTNVVHSKNTL